MTSRFEGLAELASPGGRILFATDDFFQVAENLIMKNDPVWDEHKFTTFGKWMDGWETRRKRTEGHDWCILKLGLSGIIAGIDADTAFFTGNQTLRISIQAACLESDDLGLVRRSEMGTRATADELEKAVAVGSDKWEEILAISPLKPGYPDQRHNYFEINSGKRWTHLRVNYFPDGGVARLRVYGHVSKDWSLISVTDIVDLVAMENGGKPISFTNSHYGHPFKMIQPGASEGMYDGWETARNPNRPPIFIRGDDGHLIMPGFETSTFALGHKGIVDHIIIDTSHFKGNYPESALVEAICHSDLESPLHPPAADSKGWFPLVSRSLLTANAVHSFKVTVANVVTHLRITIYPDGGIARLRVMGFLSL